MDNQRNLLLAVALSGLLIIGWDFAMRTFYPEAALSSPAEQVEPAAQASAGGAPGTTTVAADLPEGAAAPAGPVDMSEALADPNRVVIDTPKLAGSINLVGAQIDDIVLKDYRQSVEKDSGPVRLFAPARTEDQYFAQFGFITGGEYMPSNAVWQASGDKLTPDTPVTLTRSGDDGLTYSIALSIDEDYMISATQSVANASEAAAIIQPFTLIDRTDKNASPDEFIVHSGPIGVFDGALQDGNNYEELTEIGRDVPAGNTDWLGFTDRYWLSALIPGEGATKEVGFRALDNGLFRSGVFYQAQTIPAGGSLTQSTRLFAGAKNSIVLDKYEDSGITYFGKAISWGWFEFIEKPFLWLLRTLNGLVGNFGVAIILLTVIVRGLMFPIAQKQFASMAGMKAVQPKMKAIQERYKDDKQQQQQEIMKLYKEEKVNPLAGCLPILIQIPIFFALYKVLMLAIEMRHEPFLYIRDLSGPDPATILNLFGYLPFEVPGFLGIGVLAVLLGVTMWLTFKLNPSAMDPMQQQIFNLMPWILMFVMAPFAAGLLIYWVTSNILTLAQQKYLYSKHPALKAQAEKEKAEMAKKKADEDKAKGKA
ncbi:membrane protein insertase YidC [Erythrobacter crassostreae]|uniref:Membrane protein insertase YidC n=1 Tax=Erythrobacter crassostreae TaxID=2828328 RepID=A0A9X1F186_9SPHN|nr:membrane protein insertase YidC [Erythrobacter crassostrea]MBV7258227.1 membrane protein insertase YidC [Erythrobacter crassostrea]